MSLFIVFMVILALANQSRCLERVVGGGQADIFDFPYQLSIRRNGIFLCGGALISNRYAISAAHCFEIYSPYSVRAGSAQRDYGGVTVNVKSIFFYPPRLITKNRFEHDIAILEFETPLYFTPFIQPVKLPENDDLLLPGIEGVVSGFGDVTDGANKGSRILRSAKIPLASIKRCQKAYNFNFKRDYGVFCAGLERGGKDSCQGDSGGPFVIGNVLYGLVSFGIGCGAPGYPGVYTNVAAYRDFIRDNTGL